MDETDELQLPDGRTLHFRRERDPRGGLRGSTALRVTSHPSGPARRPAASADAALGRHLDIVA